MQRRLTDGEQKQIQELCGGLEDLDVYVSGRLELTEKLLAMLKHNTTDGLPYVDPELTDEDARQRPWVIIWDDRQNNIPNIQRLVHVAEALEYRFSVANSCGSVTRWKNCRRATPAEIAAAGLEVAE